MKKALITGAAGLMGQALANYLKENHILLGVDMADNPFPAHRNLRYIQADLADFARLKPEITGFKPDFIFNCAAYSDVDGCETNKRLAEQINIGLVENLLNVPFAKLIHYSSDYVFNGQAGPYAEDDQTDPLSYYGWTKLQSELLLRKSPKNCLIIRTNVLYGNGVNTRSDFMHWVAENLRQNKMIRVVNDQFNNPTYVNSLAEASTEAAQSDYSGVLHLAGPGYYSRYEIAIIIAGLLKLNPDLIKSIPTSELDQTAIRPKKGGLKIDRAAGLLKTKFLDLESGLKIVFNLK
jgi:dTDP-4-dehydrorhamnose reductase